MAKANTTWKVPQHGPIEKLSDRLWRVEAQLGGMPMKRVMAIARRADGISNRAQCLHTGSHGRISRN